MKLNNIYGDRFFEADGKEGGNPPAPVVDKEIEAKLERLAHLEKENKDLIASRDKAKDAKRKEEESKLLEEKKYQELLNAKEKEIESLKPKVDAFDQLRQVEIDEAKKVLGDKWDDEYESLSLIALRKTVQLLNVKENVAGSDNGKIIDPPKLQLTEAQKREALEKFPHSTKEKAEQAWFEVLKETGKIK